jgi:hypothetical protein
MRKIILLLVVLVSLTSLMAKGTKIKSKHLIPNNAQDSIEVLNQKTEKGRDYYVLTDESSLEYIVPEGYEAYGFVRTLAENVVEPDLNVFFNDTLSMLLSVPTSKSIKYTSAIFNELSRAKKLYITPQLGETTIKLSTTHNSPILVRMYIKKLPNDTLKVVKTEEQKS